MGNSGGAGIRYFKGTHSALSALSVHRAHSLPLIRCLEVSRISSPSRMLIPDLSSIQAQIVMKRSWEAEGAGFCARVGVATGAGF